MILMQNDVFIVVNDFFPINKNNIDDKFKMLNSRIEKALKLKNSYINKKALYQGQKKGKHSNIKTIQIKRIKYTT